MTAALRAIWRAEDDGRGRPVPDDLAAYARERIADLERQIELLRPRHSLHELILCLGETGQTFGDAIGIAQAWRDAWELSLTAEGDRPPLLPGWLVWLEEVIRSGGRADAPPWPLRAQMSELWWGRGSPARPIPWQSLGWLQGIAEPAERHAATCDGARRLLELQLTQAEERLCRGHLERLRALLAQGGAS